MAIGEYFSLWKSSDCEKIQGWLHDEAVRLTEIIFNAQSHLGLSGLIVEIGVWKGKYFSALLELQQGRSVFGYDIWLNEDIHQIQIELSKSVRNKNFELFRLNSRDLHDKSERLELDEKEIHFVSIDGDHTLEGALSDMRLSAKLISPGGVLALDDYLNPGCLGTTESAFLFLQESDFEPICYITNKLFVTTKGWGEVYRQRIELAISQNPDVLGIQLSGGVSNYLTSIAGKKLYSFRQ